MNDEIKLAGMEALVPEELEKHLILNSNRLRTFEDARLEIVTYVEVKFGFRIRDSKPSDTGFSWTLGSHGCWGCQLSLSLSSGKGKWSPGPRDGCCKCGAAQFQRRLRESQTTYQWNHERPFALIINVCDHSHMAFSSWHSWTTRSLESTLSSSPSDLMTRLSQRGRCFPRLSSSFSWSVLIPMFLSHHMSHCTVRKCKKRTPTSNRLSKAIRASHGKKESVKRTKENPKDCPKEPRVRTKDPKVPKAHTKVKPRKRVSRVLKTWTQKHARKLKNQCKWDRLILLTRRGFTRNGVLMNAIGTTAGVWMIGMLTGVVLDGMKIVNKQLTHL